MLLLGKALRRLVKRGELSVTDHKGRIHNFGRPDPEFGRIAIRFTDARVPHEILRDTSLGTAEAYMDGRLLVEEGDIFGLVDLIRGNAMWEEGRSKGAFGRSGSRLLKRLRTLNPVSRSRRNVAHHYDLSGALYELFLDSDRQYSCAYYRHPANSLEQAQADKKAHIAAKLHLKPGQRVLDIGCGWGGMALYLNRVADVDVLGITLSEEQLKVARARAAEAGVADRVRFELIDYRLLEGRFDRIVSVGMFEHVGTPNYPAFFAKCRELLAEDGVMLLHTIGRMGGPGTTDNFTNKYIFPGGYIPALSEMVGPSEQARLLVSDVETLRLHYAYTLKDWYRRTEEKKAEIVALYDERFFRMWQFYLAGSHAAFWRGGMVNYQVQYVRNRRALPITRDYMEEAEARYRDEA